MVLGGVVEVQFGDALLLEDFGGDPADEAAVLLVLLDAVLGVPELPEGVDHDTRDDVPEEHGHEDVVEDVEDEPGGVEGGDIVPYLLADVEGDDALGDGLAVLHGDVVGVDGFHVGVEGEDGEDYDEGEPEKGDEA